MNDFAEHSLLSILAQHAHLEPDRTAFFFLRDGTTIQDRISYGQLWAEASRVAAYLSAQRLEEQRILLLFPPGLDFVKAFLGCLIAKAIAVPVFPAHRNDHLHRIAAIAADAQSTLALSTRTAIRRMEKLEVGKAVASLPPCMALEDLLPTATAALPNMFDRATVAFLQYTSGSTGSPKGILIRHGNLLQNLTDLDQGGEHTRDSSIISWLPVYHDMGLIYGVLLPLYKGIPGYLLSPVSFLARPLQWLEAISHYKITHTVAPNFAFDLCMDAEGAQGMSGVDFSHLIALGNGAEPIRADTLLRFLKWLAPFGLKKEALCPCYGLAEATLKVATRSPKQDLLILPLDARQLREGRVEMVSEDSAVAKFVVGCGSSTTDTAVCIVDAATELACAPGQVGEIWVKGSTVAGGYWNQPAASADVFAAYRKDSGEGPFLRTGDLGFLHEGQLFVTGRIKDMLIIHGVNHYPHDIEATVKASHPLLQKEICATIALSVAGEERLVVLQEFDAKRLGGDDSPASICETIHESVVRHHEIVPLSVILVKRHSIPHTSSGKKQRMRCRALLEQGQLDIISHSNPFFDKADSPESWISAMVFQSMVQADSTALVWGKQTVTYGQLLVIWHRTIEKLGLSWGADEGFDFLPHLKAELAATTTDMPPLGDLPSLILERPSVFLPGQVETWAPFVLQLRQKFASPESATVGIPNSLPHKLALASAVWAWSKGIAVHWPTPGMPEAGLDFSLLYFSSQAAAFNNDKYRLLTVGARFADQHAFKAVWIPERHFHDFGGLYPDPAVLAAYLAAQTSRIRLRAGSVVLTLHDPILVAESWAVVDNLSGGRVDLAFARGWNPNDFVLAPDTYANSTAVLFERVKTVQQLWQGGSVERTNGNGVPTSVRIYPMPAQAQLQTWITCSGGPDRFAEAGALGANVLTALLFQTPEQLAEKIQVYRRARVSHGFEAETGIVTLMLHTHLGADTASVRQQVRAPFMVYLKSSIDLWKNGFADLGTLETEGVEQLLDYAFERYYREAALFGTVEDCLPMLRQLRASGVNEIACLLDFGVPDEAIIASFPYLERLKAAFDLQVFATVGSEDSGERFWIEESYFSPHLPEALQPPVPQSAYPEKASMPRGVGPLPTQVEVTEKILEILSGLLDTPLAMLETDQSFQRLGLNSIKAVRLTTALSGEWGIDIPPTWLFEFTSIDALAQQIAQTLRNVPQADGNLLSQNGESMSALEQDRISQLPEADLVELLRNTLGTM